MTLTQEQIKELNLAALPVIEWLRANAHPHIEVIIDGDSVAVTETICYTPGLFQEE